MPPFAWKALLVWIAIVPLAILNGLFRQTILNPVFGPQTALPLSGILLGLLIFLLTWLALPWLGPIDKIRCILVGAVWLVLTVVFEFVFGHLVAGKTWHELLLAYDISRGNLWPAVLVVTTASPWLAGRLRGVI